MAITRATDLAVAKSDGTAETVAAACWDYANTLDLSDASTASKIRQLRRLARELLELHSIDPAEVLVEGTKGRTENGHAVPDHEMLRALGTHAEG
jgi:hypothetical protein